MPRYNSRAMLCSPGTGAASAPAAKATRLKRQKAEEEIVTYCERDGEIPVHKIANRLVKVTGVFKIIGKIQRPVADDQLVYLDD